MNDSIRILVVDDEASQRELVSGTSATRQALSKHLALLEAVDLVVTRWRGREKLHFLNPLPLQALLHATAVAVQDAAARGLSFGAPTERMQSSLGSGVIVSPDGVVVTCGGIVEYVEPQERDCA